LPRVAVLAVHQIGQSRVQVRSLQDYEGVVAGPFEDQLLSAPAEVGGVGKDVTVGSEDAYHRDAGVGKAGLQELPAAPVVKPHLVTEEGTVHLFGDAGQTGSPG